MPAPEELAARSAARRDATDQRVLAALLAAGEAGLRPGELVAAAGRAERTVRASVRRLGARGLILREGKRRIRATAAGRSQAGAGVSGLALAPALKQALARFPTEAQRAFLRLLLSDVVARTHLAEHYGDGWTGFIALGPTKTGKTSCARLVCRLTGSDERQAIRFLARETPGTLFGRRVQSGSDFTLRPSPLLALPFACLDEWDKAPEELRRAASALLLGQTQAEHEGERVDIRPTVLLCLNSGPAGLAALDDAYVRRSVVLDTGELHGLLDDLDEQMAELFRGELPRLALEELALPAPELPTEERKLLRDELKAGLSAEGWRLVDVEALSRLALGRAALAGCELPQAALATAFDYLSCASTVGQATPDFLARLGSKLGGQALAPDPAAATSGGRGRAAAQKQVVRERQQLALAGEWSALAARLRGARNLLTRIGSPEAAGLRTQLRLLERRAKDGGGPELLVERTALAAELIAAAEAFAAEEAAERRRAKEAEQRQRQTLKETAERLRALRQLRGRLDLLRQRKRTNAGEDPLAVLRALTLDGQPLVVYAARPAPESWLQAGAALADVLQSMAGYKQYSPGCWRSPFDPGIAFPGDERACAALRRWGAATRAVLEAALRRVDELEQVSSDVRASLPKPKER